MPKLSRTARRRLSLAILLVGLPAYVVLAVEIAGRLGRLPAALEFAVYAILGVAWILPFKAVFRGIGRAEEEGAERRGGDAP